MRFPMLIVVFAFAAGPLHAGETVALEQVGVRLTLPDGFAPAPEVIEPHVVAAFNRPLGAGRQLPTVILVSRLGGPIGRETTFSPEVQARNPSVVTSTEQWKGFDVVVFRVPEKVEGVNFATIDAVTLNAQVPIRQGAVQVSVFGEADQEAELRELLRAVLAGLEGETNWLTPQQRTEQLVTGFLKLGVLIGVFVAFFVLIRKGRRQRKSAPDSM